MNNKLTTLAATIMIAASATAQSWPTPSPEAKAGSRWWWLGSAVDKENISWNLEEYSRAGIGALEITPIYGVKNNDRNNLDFLSPEWMDALSHVQAEGRRNNILIDMNNGTGWPFGGPTTPIDEAAAKMVYTDVTVTGKELRKGIDISVKDAKEKPYAKLSRVMAYPADDNTASSSKHSKAHYLSGIVDLTAMADGNGMVTWKKAPKKATYRIISIYCSRTRQKVKRAAPGGAGYVMDHFDRQAVANYLKRFDDAFEKSGTPYPHTMFNDSYEVYRANWTPRLFEEFEARRGYKLEYHLPELLGEKDDDSRVLIDYRETLSDLLLENFTEQWTAWAHRHGSKTRNQAHGSPANLIDQYSAVDIPEIEGFGLSEFGIKGLRRDSGFTRKNDSDVSMLKYASSAAHINGKTLVSSETFTWLTEHFRTSLSQCKPDLDLMFSCGVNNVYFHGTAYSPKNDPWPGWKFYASIDMSPTNSIWRDAPYMLKYIERCQSFLQMGQPDNDFLVYLPVRDMWAQRKGTGTGSLLMQFSIHHMASLAPEFIRDILAIDKAGYDCDYISDKYLLTTTYKEGMLETAAGTRYKALVIPGNDRMTDRLKAHIESLKSQGAKIIYGTDDSLLAAAARKEALRSELGLRALRRKNATGHHYFIANLTPDDISKRVSLTVDMKDARWFNPLNGDIYAVDFNNDGVMINLKSGESMILQTYDHILPQPAQPRQQCIAETEKTIDGPWTLSFVESAPKVEKSFTLDTTQTWETLDDDSVKATMGTGVYTTTVTMTRNEAQDEWQLLLGDVRESARVYINGTLIGCAWSVPFTLDCGKAFREGDNTLAIEVTNLPANRIAHLDRQGIEWRKFNEINIVNINYKKSSYKDWTPMKSGLNSAVRLYRVR